MSSDIKPIFAWEIISILRKYGFDLPGKGGASGTHSYHWHKQTNINMGLTCTCQHSTTNCNLQAVVTPPQVLSLVFGASYKASNKASFVSRPLWRTIQALYEASLTRKIVCNLPSKTLNDHRQSKKERKNSCSIVKCTRALKRVQSLSQHLTSFQLFTFFLFP